MAAADGWDYQPDSSDTTGVGKWLVSSDVRRMVTDGAELGAALYRERVTKVTGENARLVRVHTAVETWVSKRGRTSKRWVGYTTAYSLHALAREFGNKRTPNPEHTLRDVANDLETGF